MDALSLTMTMTMESGRPRVQKGFRLPAGGTVAHRDGSDSETLAQSRHLDTVRLRPAVTLVGIDNICVKQLALAVETHKLAARAEAWIDGHNVFRPTATPTGVDAGSPRRPAPPSSAACLVASRTSVSMDGDSSRL